MSESRPSHDLTTTITANGLILAILAYAGLLLALHPDLYYRSVQEDEYLEWATFWSFVLASGAFLAAAWRSYREQARLPFFLPGLALFCAFVAMEEISWGQRLLGYRPPAYLLEHNFQQEMNVHNVVDDSLRRLAFLGVILGYGVLLPAALRLDRPREMANRLGIVAPPLVLIPAFAATAAFYEIYPWTHTGEWAELMLGISMLFAAALNLRAATCNAAGPHSIRGAGSRLVLTWLVAILLGVATAEAWRSARLGEPEQVEVARVELAALRRDVAAARTKTDCGLHKRVYSFVETYQQDHLRSGRFAALVVRGLPEERAEFFLDPWNSPYWVRHICSADWTRRAVYVYSFGPNRRRDSVEWRIFEDDVGAWISRPQPEGVDE
ncbi:MAG: hypothetical protein JRH17_09385 [Deltaproteobacteria bacterium]|nr:hypothetical protein [Deltaproteobacteria bacterium]